MRMSLPMVLRGDGQSLFDVQAAKPDDNLVLFLYIDFSVKNRDIGGFIALLMDLPSITALKKIVNDFIAGVSEQTAARVG
jgi:chemotaxis protein CheC